MTDVMLAMGMRHLSVLTETPIIFIPTGDDGASISRCINTASILSRESQMVIELKAMPSLINNNKN